jgi:hypothetical protein
MPNLIAAGWDDNSGVAFIWKCSECKEAFSHRITAKPSQAEIDGVNKEFAEHCEKAHPSSKPVFGTDANAIASKKRPTRKEDVNQAAARIVGEATRTSDK